WSRWVLSLAILAVLIFFLYWDTKDKPERLISLIGLILILLLGFVFSSHPGRVRWRTVLMGLLIQFLFGVIFIRWDPGRLALQCFSDKVATFLSYGTDGAEFAFGTLLVRTEQVFAFSSLPVIFFFSMLVEVLFFWGALQWFCLTLGRLLRSATSTTVCESVICIGNVFLGMSESILMIRPYIALLTPSEIHVVMASGFATVSGTILASYIAFGAEPAHLVTASVMSAPAAICMSKLLMPETKRSLTTVENIKPVECEDQSVLSAATRGATNGIALLLNIVANIVAFVSFIAFVNGVLGYCGGLLGFADLTLEWIFGKIFIPLAWVMGMMIIFNFYITTNQFIHYSINQYIYSSSSHSYDAPLEAYDNLCPI
ncbi:sodium/nucleoside cotransporter 1-like, partial [Hyposmocoma kahamanoa]|uniref:sodium/nucleoside cotransporter 1-like n=1 Tax=Hyposmocoma kahamanoa TaxID=1477025 RepID=UPI000E6D9D69